MKKVKTYEGFARYMKLGFYSSLILIVSAVFSQRLSTNKKKTTDSTTGQLLQNIRVLQDLDAGDIKSAREKLTDESMELTIQILENVKFATNKDVLCAQPGLRAAARYWGTNKLPTDSIVLNDPILSNVIYDALATVTAEFTNAHAPTTETH